MNPAVLAVSAEEKVGMARISGGLPRLAEIRFGALLESLKYCAAGVNLLSDAHPGVRVLWARVTMHGAW